MKEKRKILQQKIYNEDGKLQCVVIPNYTKTDYFMSKSEITFYKLLILIVKELKEKNNIDLKVFPQVAVNRIIRQNNQRESELEKDIFARSIDFVLYDQQNDEIFCCIELDGTDHKTDENKIKRDKILDDAFKGIYKLIRIDVEQYYDKDNIINKILN